MKIYQYSRAAKLKDFFDEEFIEKLELKNEQLNTVSFRRGKLVHSKFVRSVFTDFLKLILQDCIDNGVKFVGHGSFWFQIWINKMPDWEIDRITKSNIYRQVNLIESDFNIYNFMFYSPFLPQGDRYRNIRIGYEKYHEMVDKVNNGKRYTKRAPAHTYHRYMPEMRNRYPLLTKEQLSLIIKEGCYQMQRFIVVERRSVQLRNTKHKFSMSIYKHVSLAKIRKRKLEKENNGSN